MKLFRPVGIAELELIVSSDWKAFPPRLPDQPIFYPVCNLEYACKIARDWNVPAGRSGFVVEFEIEDEYISQFDPKVVGSKDHKEYWIPAEELDAFNKRILSMKLVKVFYEAK